MKEYTLCVVIGSHPDYGDCAWSEGHHDRQEFLEEVLSELEGEGRDDLSADISQVSTGYWVYDEETRLWEECSKYDEGAIPFTHCWLHSTDYPLES